MKKNNFLTFCFAFIPGAGEMYLGMMQKGLAIMTLFWGVIGLATFLQMGYLGFVLPIIWFYSFFDTFNIKALPYDQRLQMDREFASNCGSRLLSMDLRIALEKRHVFIGWALVLIGGWAIFSNFAVPLMEEVFQLSDLWIFRYLTYRLPSLAVTVAIILFGVYLIRGKKKPTSHDDDYVEYRGEFHG